METTYSEFRNGQHVVGADVTSAVYTSQDYMNVYMSIANSNWGTAQISGTRSYDILLLRKNGSGWDVIGRRYNVGSKHVGLQFHETFTNIGVYDATMKIRIHSYYGRHDSNTGEIYRDSFITTHETPWFTR